MPIDTISRYAPPPAAGAGSARSQPPAAAGGKLVPRGGSAEPPAAPAPDRAAIERAVQTIEQFMRDSARSLRLRYDEQLGRAVITVVDPRSGEVIRQIPPEYAVALAQGMAEGVRPRGFLDATA